MTRCKLLPLPRRLVPIIIAAAGLCSLNSCVIEPQLNLHEDLDIPLPIIDLELDVVWDYYIDYDGAYYDWKSHWLYGWDDEDERRFGLIGYYEPQVFNIRRYYTGWTPRAKHTAVLRDQVVGTLFTAEYRFGFYDLLTWNEVEETDGAQNLHIDETDLDNTVAYTNQTMYPTPHHSALYTNSVNAPEGLFSVYQQAIEIPDPSNNYEEYGFVWDDNRQRWVKTLHAHLDPVTYIYLTQFILVNNHGRVVGVDGSADLSGMAHDVSLNTRVTGMDPISVFYGVRMKDHRNYGITYTGPAQSDMVAYAGEKPDDTFTDEPVDVIGGKVMTFGMCGLDPVSFSSRAAYVESVQRIEALDPSPHFLDIALQFSNGTSKVFSFDVTRQVRKLFKGGVLTVVIDVDDLDIPSLQGGQGFDATVEDYEDGGTHEFPL